jgi:hypothetical protein
VVAVLLGGLVLGILWRACVPAAVAMSDAGEGKVAVDASFFLLAAAAGLITGLALWRRPGVNPALRLAVVLVASLAGSALAVGVSRLLGGHVLTVWGGLVVWPTSTTVVVALITIARLLFRST